MPTEITVALIGLAGVIYTATLTWMYQREKKEARTDREIADQTIATLRVVVDTSGCSSPSCPQRSPAPATISTASPAGNDGPANASLPNSS